MDLLGMNIVGAVLLASAVYLMLHWDRVKREVFLLVGLAGLGVMLWGNVFLVFGRYLPFLVRLFYSGGLLTAFFGVVASMYPGRLPGIDRVPTPARAAPTVEQVTEVGEGQDE